MWHEARRREKATQKLLNEHKKRAEKRREENKVDPNSLLQIHGLKAKLCLDPIVYKQAVKSLVAWQGDKSITIDRFDVRATLSSVPNESTSDDSSALNVPPSGVKQPAAKKRNLTVLDADESEPIKKILNYERFRLLIQNDLNQVPEQLRLKLVAQSDVSADAKMRKLRYNKFGTSGDACITASGQVSTSASKMGGGQFRENSTRKSGIAIGFNYNSVPPPQTNSNNSEFTASRAIDDETTNKALNIMDLDEFDNFEIDGTSNLSHFDGNRIIEIAKKYGLSQEELKIMVNSDNQDSKIGDIQKQLKRLSKRSSGRVGDATTVVDNKVYGPDLPPELVGAQNDPLPSSSSSTSSNGSPVRQRSPSGAQIPLRNGHRDYIDDDDELIDRRSCESTSTINGGNTRNKASNTRQEAHASAHESSTLIQSSQSLYKSSKSPQKATDTFDVPKPNSPPNSDNNSSVSKLTTDQESQNTKCLEQQRERRASTPLAYKRNRRSSRSLSRERRSSRHRYHPSTSKSSRRSRRSRSKSSSRSSSSESSASSYPSNASGKYNRRKHRSRQRKSTRR